ncbi:flagellar export chaperone FliS [Desulfolutivibrio sulfoxidireducens]|uniref:flagellar export chaperone FliS n=1 Tax=Desulfolutivibrio sulfoxidireducens TaxID=2773299 RepID=UPI00159D18E3|nr:flagellar export chaperone FliS [Desulfolutivibrio sulfoxidireducens]QLA15153.1 flagellar export chaperone FliS [Desulfolutivibrio sulfoxidireducens]
MQTAAKAYLKTQVNTTSQGEILILLYEGALKYLAQAREKIAARDYAAKGILISRVLDILTELQSSLNAQKGGELAGNLQKLYFYCSTRLLQANMKMDTAILDEVVRILAGLRDAFHAANAEVSGSSAANAEGTGHPSRARDDMAQTGGHNASYGVPPPFMTPRPASPGQSGPATAFPGFAKRPRPAMPAAASTMPDAPDGPNAPAGTGPPIGNAAPRQAPRPVPATAQNPAPGSPPPPPAATPVQAQSPMRRAFAAYATAKDQSAAS